MRWFGPDWGAPVCQSSDHTETPEDEDCAGCGELIQPGDQGLECPYVPGRDLPPVPIYYHLNCFLWEIGVRSAANMSRLPGPPPAAEPDGGDQPG